MKHAVLMAAAGVVVFGGIWLMTWLVASPYQRFMNECCETHEVVACHQAWHKAQPPIVIPRQP